MSFEELPLAWRNLEEFTSVSIFRTGHRCSCAGYLEDPGFACRIFFRDSFRLGSTHDGTVVRGTHRNASFALSSKGLPFVENPRSPPIRCPRSI